MKRIFYLMNALMLMLAGCSQLDILDGSNINGEVKTFTQFDVMMEASPVTRTQVEEERVYWSKDDVIGVYSDMDGIIPFTHDGNNTFKSEKAISGSVFYAFYPYSEDITVDSQNKSVVHFNLKSYLNHHDSYYKSIPMVAMSHDNSFEFRQTMGLIRLRLIDIKQFRKLALVSTQQLSGSFYVDCSLSEPIMKAEGKDTESNQLFISNFNYATNEYQLAEFDTNDFYLPVPVGTYPDGFELNLWTDKTAGAIKSFGTGLQIKRAIISEFPILRAADYEEMEKDKQTKYNSEKQKDIEREALVALYKAAGGDNWKNNSGWLSDKPVGEWYGIETYNGLVTKISLMNNNLCGELPVEIGNFISLYRMYINDNPGLTGEIPPTLGQLYNLRELKLNNNNFTGKVPELDFCSELFNLDLSDNAFSPWCIPDWIGNMNKLESLGLENCNLQGQIPESLLRMGAEIPNEKKGISLQHNSLSGDIPSFLGEFESTYIDLSHNQITGTIPDNIDFRFYFEYNNMDGVISTKVQQKSWWDDSINITQNDGHKLTLEGKESEEQVGGVEEIGDNGTLTW